MPDPPGQSPQRPERSDLRTTAPSGLRRRVLARVRSERSPLATSALHAARRRLAARRWLVAGLAAAVLIAGAGTFLETRGSGAGTLGIATVARGLGGARASLQRSGGHGELLLSGMPPPPIGEVYEVWLSRTRTGPEPTNALFNVTSAGTAAVEIPGSLRGVRVISVTPEPLGGSGRPTGPVVLSVALSGAPAGRGQGGLPPEG